MGQIPRSTERISSFILKLKELCSLCCSCLFLSNRCLNDRKKQIVTTKTFLCIYLWKIMNGKLCCQVRRLSRIADPGATPGGRRNHRSGRTLREAFKFQSGVHSDNDDIWRPEVALRRQNDVTESVCVSWMRQAVQRSLQLDETYACTHRRATIRLQGALFFLFLVSHRNLCPPLFSENKRDRLEDLNRCVERSQFALEHFV